MDDLWVWRYALESAGGLNARTGRRIYEGALVRIGAGFGCVHPWPELGDATLEGCLDDLAGERRLGLVQRTLVCIGADGAAREEGRSLFEGLVVPGSHATLPFFDEERVAEVVERGFSHVKVKAGRELGRELAEVRGMILRWPDLRWRVDLNEMGTVGDLVEIFEGWSEEERAKLDFLEDPTRYEVDEWAELRRATGISLANDFRMSEDEGDSEFLVVKPAVHEMPEEGRRRVVTSYLDHPLGQVFAAWEAARAGVGEVCGLQTHGVFAGSAFTEVLGEVGPEFVVPEGDGLGFGGLLEGLPWERLKRVEE